MVEISDELRELAVKYCYQWTKTYKDMCAIADRIDAEMVELPKSADGKIWTGREVYFWTGATEVDRHEFNSLTYINGRWCVEDKNWQRYPAASAWYERPDSFERIAAELDEIVETADADTSVYDSCEKLASLADRIRNLADKDE